MDHCLLVSMLHCLTDFDEELQALGGGQVILVAVVRDGNTAHQFHDEVRPTGLGRAAVQHPRDIRMVHQRQSLALSFKARDHLAGVHSRFDNLERYLSLYRLLLFGHINDPETALADLRSEENTSEL